MSEVIKKAPASLGASLNKSIGFETAEDSSLKEEPVVEQEAVVEQQDVQTEEPTAKEEEDSQPTPTNVNEDSETKAEEPTAKTYTQEELDSILKEKLEDAKFEWEDELEGNTPQEEDDAFIARLKGLKKDGYKIDDPNFWRFQTEDIDKKISQANSSDSNALNLLVDAYKIQNPEVPTETVLEKLKLKYEPLLSGDFDKEDREYRLAKLDLSEEVSKAGKVLKDYKEKVSLPRLENIIQENKQAEIAKKISEQRPKAERKFRRRVDKYLNENESYSLKLGDDTIQYDFSKEDKAKIKERLNNLMETLPELVTVDGLNEKPIEEGLLEQVANSFVRNDENIFNSILEKAAKHLASIKMKETADKLKNTQAPSESGSRTEVKQLTDLEKIGAAMRKRSR